MSLGRPKALIQTSRMLSIYDAHRKLDAGLREDDKLISSRSSCGRPTPSVLPVFWLGGLLMTIIAPIMWDSLPVLLSLDIPRPTPRCDPQRDIAQGTRVWGKYASVGSEGTLQGCRRS